MHANGGTLFGSRDKLKNNPGKLSLFILTPLLIQSTEWTLSCDFIQESFTENALDSLT